MTGLHCCGTADWRLLMQAGPQILSLPTDGGIETAGGALASFLERGGLSFEEWLGGTHR